MYKQVFISHSKSDPHIDFFHKVFSGLRTKAVYMEYEDILNPPWDTIRSNLNESNAVFVLLSEPLLNQRHTNNWVSFEIGLACNYRASILIDVFNTPPEGLPVYVFEPLGQPVDFPVPYCNYYMPYEETIQDLKFLKELITNSGSVSSPIYGNPIICPYDGCSLVFNLLRDIDKIACPSCRQYMSI